MTKLIVDSNIIFSAIEIWEHQEKIKKIGKLNVDEFLEVYKLVLKNVTILNHSIVPKEKYLQAFEL